MKTGKQKTQIHRKIAEGATQTHTQTLDTKKRLRARGMMQREIAIKGGAGRRLSAPVPDDECGDNIIRAINIF